MGDADARLLSMPLFPLGPKRLDVPYEFAFLDFNVLSTTLLMKYHRPLRRFSMPRILFRTLVALSISFFFYLLPLTAQSEPMVVYSVGSDLFIGNGSPTSFIGFSQGSVTITDLAIDPASRKIYYFDTLNATIGIANSDGTPAGSLALSTPLITPRNIRITQGILYYSDTGYSSGTPQLRTFNLSTNAEGTLPVALAEGVDEFVIDTKNGRVIYGTDSSTSAVVESSKLDGTAVTTHFTPSTGTTSLEIYGETLLRADFGTQGRITQFNLPTLSTSTIVRAGASGNGRPDVMAADFANGVYYYLDRGASTGGLYVRTISATGNLEQTKLLTLTNAGGLDVLEAESTVLTPTTMLTAPPVLLSKTANSITIQLIEFSDVALASNSVSRRSISARELRLAAAKAKQKLTFRYEVRVKSETGKTIRNITAKKNIVTVKNLKPGNYTTDYRATIYVKKTAAQKAKAKAAGKKGMALDFTKKSSTNFSPTLAFTLP